MIEIDSMIARRNLYFILSLMYKNPTKDILESIIENWDDFGISLKQLNLDVKIIDEIDIDRDAWSIEELNKEYTRLFVGTPPLRAVCSPYESYWKYKTIMSSTVEDLNKKFAEIGMRISSDFRDLPDHISVELEFMFHVYNAMIEGECENNDYDLEKLMRLKREFVREHLDWVNNFTKKLENESKNKFFKTLSILTRKILEVERKKD